MAENAEERKQGTDTRNIKWFNHTSMHMLCSCCAWSIFIYAVKMKLVKDRDKNEGNQTLDKIFIVKSRVSSDQQQQQHTYM